jgi:hypothetical protein
MKDNNNKALGERAFIFVAIVSILLTILVSIMHEIYITLNK